MQEFSFRTRIFFGEGALEGLRRIKNRRVLIVTDQFMVGAGVPDKLAAYLEGCQVSVFGEVKPDPPVEVIAEGVRALRESDAQVMIAVGGGSSIDAAKIIRATAYAMPEGQRQEVEECYAIPTTSGTGSEVTEYAVISDKQKGVKYPLASEDLQPPVAILDPALVVSAPPKVTADTGMDVLTHALEAYVSTGANDFSDALAEKAVSLVFRFLPLAYRDGSDLLAREKMHNASCMAGLAFNSAGLGVCHGIAHTIGGKFHIPHGRANAMVLPLVLQYNADVDHARSGAYSTAAKKYQRMAKIADLPAYNVRIGVSNLIRAVQDLNRSLQIPSTLKAYGIDPREAESLKQEMIQAALQDGTTATNPRPVNEAEVGKIIQRLIS